MDTPTYAQVRHEAHPLPDGITPPPLRDPRLVQLLATEVQDWQAAQGA